MGKYIAFSRNVRKSCYCKKVVSPENLVYNNNMAQHYDNAAKYIMLEYSQEFAEFTVGHSNITFLERLETEEPTLKTHQND